MITYSILYTPEEKENPGINYVCSDNKIHVRFRDFNKPQVIKGFEKKLTYLMAYLMNYSFTSELFGHCNEKTIINALLESKDVRTIYDAIKYDMQIDFKAFRLTPNYKRKDEPKPFGEIEDTAFPLKYDEFERPMEATLEIFLNKLRINLLDYLFNDSYTIIIHEMDENTSNDKFINKAVRKANQPSDYIELW